MIIGRVSHVGRWAGGLGGATADTWRCLTTRVGRAGAAPLATQGYPTTEPRAAPVRSAAIRSRPLGLGAYTGCYPPQRDIREAPAPLPAPTARPPRQPPSPARVRAYAPSLRRKPPVPAHARAHLLCPDCSCCGGASFALAGCCAGSGSCGRCRCRYLSAPSWILLVGAVASLLGVRGTCSCAHLGASSCSFSI